MGEAEIVLKPKLRWYQYRLAHLFIFVTICAIPCSWFACRMVVANKQKKAVEAAKHLGLEVRYDYQCDANGNNMPDAEPPGPAWFRNLVGVDFLADVVTVCRSPLMVCPPHRPRPWYPFYVTGPTDTDDWIKEHLTCMTELRSLFLGQRQIVTDAGLVHLKTLTNLRSLSLRNAQVTDAGLVHLKELSNLTYLSLERTQITDAGLEHLKGLTRLERLYLCHARVTDDGLEQLRRALPNCEVRYSRYSYWSY